MPLPTISGLYALAADKRIRAGHLSVEALANSTTPRHEYELKMQADQLRKEAKEHEDHARSDEKLVEGIEQLINYLVHSPHKSAGRTLAQRKLEEASGHLRRECGDPPGLNGKHHPHG